MDFSKLEYIIKVAEVGNITHAAEELYMTQPALSHFITRIEKEEGVRIFDRSCNPITLTYAGERYVETAKKIIELNRQLQEEMTEVGSARKGRIRIGIPPLRAAWMLPKFIPVYSEEYPEVEIQTLEHNSRQLREDVLKGKVDFAVLPHLGSFDDFSVIPLCREELVLAVREGFLGQDKYETTEEGRHIIHFERLRDTPFILLKSGHGSRKACDILFELNDYEPNIFMETTNNETAFGLAAAGMGAAVIPVSTVMTINHNHPVQLFHLSEAGYYWDVVAIHRKDERLTLLPRDCILMMKEVFEEADDLEIR